MTIPLLSNVFSTPGHLLEEYHFSAACPRCHQMGALNEIQSIETDGLRTYHCPWCMAIVATICDPAQISASAECYQVAGWAVRPLTTVSIALEVSAIKIPPLGTVSNVALRGRQAAAQFC